MTLNRKHIWHESEFYFFFHTCVIILESWLWVGISQTWVFQYITCLPVCQQLLARWLKQNYEGYWFLCFSEHWNCLACWGWEEMPTKEQKGWRTFCNTASNRSGVQPSAERERRTGAKIQRSKQKEEKFEARKHNSLHNSSSVGGWAKEKKRKAETRKN